MPTLVTFAMARKQAKLPVLVEAEERGGRVGGRFEGKVVVITGGGSGIGRAFGHRFAAEGAATWSRISTGTSVSAW